MSGWRGGSVAMSTHCFSRGPKFSAQHPNWDAHTYISSSMGSDTLFWALWAHKLTCVPPPTTTLKHIINIFLNDQQSFNLNPLKHYLLPLMSLNYFTNEIFRICSTDFFFKNCFVSQSQLETPRFLKLQCWMILLSQYTFFFNFLWGHMAPSQRAFVLL